MARQLDWYQASIAMAEKLPENPAIEVIRRQFALIESALVEARFIVGEKRDRMIDLLQTHAQSLGSARNDPMEHWLASVEVIKFVYSLIRDRAYEVRNQQMLVDLAQVHNERLCELQKAFAFLVMKDTSGNLAKAMEQTLADTEAMHATSVGALISLGPPKKTGPFRSIRK